jgi:hypothetical protein
MFFGDMEEEMLFFLHWRSCTDKSIADVDAQYNLGSSQGSCLQSWNEETSKATNMEKPKNSGIYICLA